MLFQTGQHNYLETKQGSYIYSGDASSFLEWELRTRLRMQGVNEDRYAENTSKIVDGLRGDAVIATQVGLQKLWQSPVETEEEERRGGLETLVKAMKCAVFPLMTHEGKEVFRQYSKPSGSLS